MELKFTEKQKFTQWWLWLLLIIVALIPLYGIYKQLMLGEKFGNNPMSDLGLIITEAIIFLLLAFFYSIQLNTRIDNNGIQMRFFPFVKKSIPWNEIKKAEVINYGFVGGWGIRLYTKYGTVYNTGGNIGLAIEFVNGKKFLIGTQREVEMRDVLKKLEIKR